MKKPKISACLVIYNEEKLLPRCLESIKDVVDEIIVVHDGPCTDKSLGIAESFGARIFVRNHIGEAEPHRPFSYEQSTGDWVLQIDADEYLSEAAQKVILELVSDPNADGYAFWWPFFYKNRYLTSGHYSKLYKPCLFRKSRLNMVGVIHESPSTYGILKNITVLLEHRHPYDNWSLRVIKKKWLNWAKLQAYETKHLEEAPLYNINVGANNESLNNLRFRCRYPLISLFWEIIRIIGINVRDGLFWSGFVNLKIMVSDLLNSFFLHWYLLTLDEKSPLQPGVEKPAPDDSLL